jgi:hypothetical protein
VRYDRYIYVIRRLMINVCYDTAVNQYSFVLVLSCSGTPNAKSHVDKSGERGGHRPFLTVRSSVNNNKEYLNMTARVQKRNDSKRPHFRHLL